MPGPPSGPLELADQQGKDNAHISAVPRFENLSKVT